ncbi:hypothetical protein TK90_2852 (plasmid) [Thioalkalivibrio sp. K90mix]|uniref:hypothetical protein n=1 Tax=Thioalkalivibrio sp. (strain K90mix) TaxID=396595 RepID=UPI000195A8C7|nr:hypothetical protein [Thioalkalivibrio sp. K90mix]ADC73336.1 hypothetical protein TK90_2852 [Thioalkalivibrio sp. K90mix]
MFSLIITIISIALVAALAVATLYYGGSAFTEGTTQANASGVINQAQQVGGGATLFTVRNAGDHPVEGVDGVQELADDDYLSSIPAPAADITDDAWEMGGPEGEQGFVHITGLGSTEDGPSAVCAAINEEAGVDEEDASSVTFGEGADLLDTDHGALPYACDENGVFAYSY